MMYMFSLSPSLSNPLPLLSRKVFFWSFGDRINPNLYDNGKVCLSLLGTWSGAEAEMWQPDGSSNILQVGAKSTCAATAVCVYVKC